MAFPKQPLFLPPEFLKEITTGSFFIRHLFALKYLMISANEIATDSLEVIHNDNDYLFCNNYQFFGMHD